MEFRASCQWMRENIGSHHIINAKGDPPLDFALQMLAMPQKPRTRN